MHHERLLRVPQLLYRLEQRAGDLRERAVRRTIPGCDPGSSPNGDAADAAINTLSHEHNEAITDPFGDGWWNVDSGQENGDNCAWIFGSALGGTHNVDEYNQIINGHHYWLQEEWSNDGSACVQHYLGVPVELPRSDGLRGGRPGASDLRDARRLVRSPTSYAYQWQRCAADGSSCANIPGATAATYTLAASDVGHTIRTAVSAHNGAGTAGFVQSAATALVVAVPAATAVPVLSGTAVVGKTLTTTAGAWNTQATFAYSWLRCNAGGTGCSAIAGATSTTYVATTADRGSTLVLPRRGLERRGECHSTLHAHCRRRRDSRRDEGAAHLRPRAGGTEALRKPRLVERLADELSLPVAPVQQARRSVRGYQGRNPREVQAREARCTAQAPRPHHRDQRRGQQGGHVAADRIRAALALRNRFNSAALRGANPSQSLLKYA